ncbi:hypothetical protein VIGAN_07146600 [Vigna angularis var. angularis]|uniref:Uncharacterized protein n=1 Tax=Vigna angularis var. angularis TaxID=157739 RepID=A0A0S3SIK0_PHAAN|nr:uncharacterized protein LOC108334341 [Vigna angularis]BAT92668.1 hypothetical protein VIGAN_07146600 [Vigna angularis var. angularis]
MKRARNQLEQFLNESNNMLQKVMECIDGIILPIEPAFDEPIEKVKWLADYLNECQDAKVVFGSFYFVIPQGCDQVRENDKKTPRIQHLFAQLSGRLRREEDEVYEKEILSNDETMKKYQMMKTMKKYQMMKTMKKYQMMKTMKKYQMMKTMKKYQLMKTMKKYQLMKTMKNYKIDDYYS